MDTAKVGTGRTGLGTFLVLFATVCMSTEAVAAKIAYEGGATVMIVLTLRYILAAVVFWLLIRVGRYDYRLSRKQLLSVLALSLGTQTLTVLALFEAFRFIPAGMAILFLYLYPVLVTILAVLFLKEPLTLQKGLALIITLAGCVIILGQPVSNLDLRGVLLSLAAAVTNSVFLIGTARLLNSIQTPVYNAYVSTVVALATGLLALSRGQASLDFNRDAWLAIIALAIFATVLAMAAFFRGIKEIGASRAAIISTFEPAATAILAFLVLGEVLTIWQIAGGVIVLSGVLVLRMPQGRFS
jgi:drug/metabolite transporter (DMT)-like permease